MMNEKVAELINTQVNKFYSAYLYLEFSNFYVEQGIKRICKLVQHTGPGGERSRDADVKIPSKQRRVCDAGGY